MHLLPAAHDAPDRRLAFAAGALGLAAISALGGLSGLAVFGDASTAESAFWGTVIAGAGGAAVWFAGQAWKWWDQRKADRKDQRAERKEDETAQVTALKDLLNRMEAERREFIRELDGMQTEVRHMTAIISSAKERIVHLEEFVIASNPKYRPWVEPPAPSARYAPAPPTLKPPAGGQTP